MGARLTGDWGRIERVLGRVAKDLKSQTARQIGRSLKKVERRVLSHLDQQDLDWQPLTEAYADSKKRKNLSPDILRATNEMYQNITTHQQDAWTGMVGVRRGVKNKKGDEVTDIALIHEQPEDDGKVIPARKLWQPTFEEMKDELAGELIGTAVKVVKKK
jgi:hypothetical protein